MRSNTKDKASSRRAPADDRNAALLEWLRAGGATLDDGLELRGCADGGRGVFATTKIPANRVVVSIPASMILTPGESAAAEALRAMGLGPDEFESPRLEREALVLSVLFEVAIGGKSRWGAYVAALPGADDLHCPVLWADHQQRWLAGTGVLTVMNKPEDDQEELPNMTAAHWEHVAWPLIQKHPELGFSSQDVAWSAYRHATALVAGYSFGLGRERVQAMVPFWDMLNHASPGGEGVRLRYEAATQRLDMITVRSIDKDKQVYNTYGPIGNAELLRRYGFVLPGISNPNDTALLEIRPDWLAALALDELVERTHDAPEIIEYALHLLDEAGILPADGCVVPVGCSGLPPPRLLEAVRLLTMDAAQLSAFSRAMAPSGPRRSYNPLRRIASAAIVRQQHAKRISAVLQAMADEALIGRRRQSSREAVVKQAGSSGKKRKKSPKLAANSTDVESKTDGVRQQLAAEVVASESRCLQALRAFAQQAEGAELSALARDGCDGVWRPLVARRRRRMRDFLFSPYHKYAINYLASVPRPTSSR